MRRVSTVLFAAAGCLAAAGCVNDYLHGELAAGTSTSAADTDPQTASSSSSGSSGSATTGASASGDAGTSAASTGDSGGSSGGGEGDTQPTTSMGDGEGGGMGDGDASSGSGGDAQLELCMGPCESNAMCAGESNLCVELTELNPVCLRACGRGCPDGYMCLERTSVEGGSAEQCVPDDNMCP